MEYMKVKEDTEAAILEAAEKLFKENGFKGTTTTLIAGQAGVTHAMLHYYFRTKEQIFIKVLDGYIMKMHGDLRMSMSPENSIVDTVCEVTGKLFDFMNMHQGELHLLLEIAETHPEYLAKYHDGINMMMGQAFQRHDERLKEAVAEGLIAPVTMEKLILEMILAAYSLFALLPMIRIAMGNDKDKLSAFIDEQKENAVRRMRDYLAVRK